MGNQGSPSRNVDLERVDRWLRAAVAGRPGGAAANEWSDGEVERIEHGDLTDDQFAQRFSIASRYAPRGPLEPSDPARAAASELLAGWNPERWTALEAVRVRLLLARARSRADGLAATVEEAFRYADEGELCALYRSLQFLPGPERFRWRAGEGCRSNMLSVFQANACDTAYPAAWLDDVAWRQLVIKCVFVGAPLWRVSGLDDRLDDELARMALDLVEERRAAGRPIQPELWLCLGRTSDPRAVPALEAELEGDDELGRKAAILALGRLGATARLEEIRRDGGTLFGPTAEWALMGRHDQTAFAAVSPPEGAKPTTFSAATT